VVTVRPARPEDAAAIAEVHVRTWQGAYAHVFGAERLEGLDVERRAGYWRDWLEFGRSGVFVAEDGGRVVGFASAGVSRDESELGELYAIYVLPDVWGSDAGTALMAAAKEELATAHEEAILWVLDDNPRARRFYEREGWTTDGGRRDEELLGVRAAEVRYRITLG
jgi:GNAT superfamily N-acetyltransferase